MANPTRRLEESESEGFVISGKDIGLRMKALEYWKCAELGLQSNPNCAVQSFKVVIAEALPNQGPNQIDTFLSEHGGPGIQHIGLHTSSMSGTIKKLKLHGVEFAEPPATYYSEVGRLHDILGVGQDVQELKELGILIDTEEEGECSKSPRYLLQKFTKPLFDRDTFFLEIIQRIGATGFGSGNITALWRSVQAYMNEKHHPEKS
ncbi:4-hydroxyphenylpyruvate dioxygenase-like protein isoform X2 [Aplysia californica]|uniref:4-hydroxyphenylpyruvate dioxygenase-like protein isoform X2 n=1 Tax=Aplysia californica TaxID=6500 RepID=A0ABM1VNR5_APLCA|nr:4-hydroxyphenylpyruvate dioxygenase-like protein isoform X2 [Aplysia californica]